MAESRLIVQEKENALVVSFPAHSMLDMSAVEAVGSELLGLVQPGRPCRLVLDLSNVSFLSSPALSMLLQLRRKTDTVVGEVVLCGVRPEIERLFRITRLDKLFRFYESQEQALAHFKQ